jgi:hypothetical protein
MKNYKNYIETVFEEWQTKSFCFSATKLNTAIGSEYFDTCNPHFYRVDIIDAKLVVVQLNPKRELKDFNQKLQVELIPFSSKFFDYTKLPQHLFSEYIELMRGLNAAN